ncbi:cysteine hydrolase [bacterium]|nr:cysteine hydrolase [bacterium]
MSKRALLVIDVQKGIVRAPSILDPEGVLKRIRTLQDRFREAGAPVLHVQHDGPSGHRVEKGTPGWDIERAVTPALNEAVINKRASDAFFETPLHQKLAALGITDLVIAGCMTQYCVDTTCRRAVSLGYNVFLASDAHTTADDGELTAAQIVSHHNTILDGFSAGGHAIVVQPSGEIEPGS